MVITDLYRKTIFLDTAPLIYYIEGNSLYQQKLSNIFQANERGDVAFITSCITLLEVMVKPLRDRETKLADQYKNILTFASGITIFEVSNDIALKAAELRAIYNLRTPDALQYATAIEYRADFFLTNDNRLKSLEQVSSVLLSKLED